MQLSCRQHYINNEQRTVDIDINIEYTGKQRIRNIQ